MSTAAVVFLFAFPAGMILVAACTAMENSGRMIDGAQAMLDDGADQPFQPDTEAAIRENLALVNDEPDPAFVARTRTLVMDQVDELAQRRRQVTS